MPLQPPALTWQLSESPAQSLIELIPHTGAPPPTPHERTPSQQQHLQHSEVEELRLITPHV